MAPTLPASWMPLSSRINCGAIARASSSDAEPGLGQCHDTRGLTDGAHDCHHGRRDADDLRTRALSSIDKSVRVEIDGGVGKRNRFESDAGDHGLFDEMFAVEEDHAVRSAPARDLAEARDERIGAAGDAAHVGPL